jgi:hypothetical protein
LDKVVVTNTSYYCEHNKSQYEKWKYFNDGIALTRIVFGIIKISNQRNKYNQKLFLTNLVTVEEFITSGLAN